MQPFFGNPHHGTLICDIWVDIMQVPSRLPWQHLSVNPSLSTWASLSPFQILWRASWETLLTLPGSNSSGFYSALLYSSILNSCVLYACILNSSILNSSVLYSSILYYFTLYSAILSLLCNVVSISDVSQLNFLWPLSLGFGTFTRCRAWKISWFVGWWLPFIKIFLYTFVKQWRPTSKKRWTQTVPVIFNFRLDHRSWVLRLQKWLQPLPA